MTRTAAREIAVQIGFGLAMNRMTAEQALEFFFDEGYFATLSPEDELFSEYPDEKQLEYMRELVTGVAKRRDELDSYIKKHSKGWKLGRISKIAVSILRTAMYEILYMEEVPDAAAINEAVELAKGYEEPETVSFINGILGSFMKDIKNED
jgi:N utilization substance protein B